MILPHQMALLHGTVRHLRTVLLLLLLLRF